MSVRARVFLHIGYPKTGTTSLQAFLGANVDCLKEQGWLFPSTGMLGRAHYALNLCLGIAAFGGEEVQNADILKSRLNDEIARSGCENVIISSEAYIAAKSVEPIKAFFSGHDLHALVYLRRHDHAFESGYSQSVRQTINPPWGPTIDSCVLFQMGISTVPQDYLGTVRKWQTALGNGKLVVRPYEKQQNQPDLYGDFLRTLGIEDGEQFARPPKVQNQSLTYATISVIDAVQRSHLDANSKIRLAETLTSLDARFANGNRAALMSPAMRNSITSRYRHSYAVIAQEFLGQDALFLEPEPKPGEPWHPPAQVTLQEAVDVLLRAFPKPVPDRPGPKKVR